MARRLLDWIMCEMAFGSETKHGVRQVHILGLTLFLDVSMSLVRARQGLSKRMIDVKEMTKSKELAGPIIPSHIATISDFVTYDHGQ